MPAVGDTPDIDDVCDLVRLDECQELKEAEVAMPNRKDSLRHTSLYKESRLNYNHFSDYINFLNNSPWITAQNCPY